MVAMELIPCFSLQPVEVECRPLLHKQGSLVLHEQDWSQH